MTTTPMVPERANWSYINYRTGLFQIALTVMVAAMLALSGADSLASQYFFDHDAYLLIAASLVLIGIGSLSSRRGSPVEALSPKKLLACCIVVAAVTYMAVFIVFHHYAVSRDEQAAEFAARYLADGRLGWPLPAPLRNLGKAMMPLYTTIWPSYVSSDYLPINSAIRALFVRIGDQWLAGPVLLAIGIAALWSCARRIWPDRPHATTIAVVMAATSTQLLVNAATPFAMTGHFALNAIWLACFLRGGRAGHAVALVIGLFASGLHQAHFHIVFVMAFVVWLAIDGRCRLAMLYGGACLFYWFIWYFAYVGLMHDILGTPIGIRSSGSALDYPKALIGRLTQMQPGESITRFLAWQNVLLLPLAITGAAAVRRSRGQERILIGCAIACLAALATPILQDHGYGYRYLHPFIPCFCLLAAGGWIALERRAGHALPVLPLAISIAFAGMVTMPVAIWRIMIGAAPYEAAYHAARSAKADYVFVDTRAGAYLQDIVRIEEKNDGPILLDLGYVPARTLTRLCSQASTVVFGEPQARSFGIPVDHYRVVNDADAQARAAQLHALDCYHPMPVG